jgi:hypothetical protein
MENKELVDKIINDFKAAPETLKGIKGELEKLFHKVVIENSEQILKLDTEEQFYDFLTVMLDTVIVLPQPWEAIDSIAIKLLLKKAIDPILDKYAPGGKDWYQKIKQFAAIKELESIEKNA